jgi:hypothetical protein
MNYRMNRIKYPLVMGISLIVTVLAGGIASASEITSENPVLTLVPGGYGIGQEARMRRERREREKARIKHEEERKKIDMAHSCDTYKALHTSLKDSRIKFKVTDNNTGVRKKADSLCK